MNNASFEATAVADGGFTTTIVGWDIGPSIAVPGGSPVGVGNPSAAQYAGGLAPDGQNVAYSKDGTISQVLTAVLLANTTYTLQVDVGHRLDNPIFLGYAVELLAGGSILSFENSLVPGAGSFLTSTVTFSTGATNAHLGQALEILLDVIAVPGGAGYQVNFDRVRLDALTSPVPEAGTLPLLALGLTGLVTIRRMKRRPSR